MPKSLNRKAPVLPIQATDVRTCLGKTAFVHNDVISNRESLLAACLRRQNSLCLLGRLRISFEQAAQLRICVAIDDEHAVHEADKSRGGQ